MPGTSRGQPRHRCCGHAQCLARPEETSRVSFGHGRCLAQARQHGRGAAGPSDAIANICAVTKDARCERTANLLIARLDALARTADRLPHPEVERLVELTSVATMRAVALELLDAERAESIWNDAHSRHPALREVEVQLPPALAA